jgi:hypothetical protein
MNFYPSDPRTLTDADLTALISEIENSGVLGLDPFDFEPEDWEWQATDRWHALIQEQDRRWEIRRPQEAAKRQRKRAALDELNSYVLERITPKITEEIFTGFPLCRVLGKT